jgi:Rieske Fe-S protein
MGLGRRKLLLVGGGVVCAHAIGCGGSSPPIVLPTEIAAGNVSAVPLNTLHAVPGVAAAIGHDAGGIYAMSLVCTHEGCDISANGGPVTFSLIHCGCHGSEYDNQGKVKLGPSTTPLPHLAVTADSAGALIIHGQQTVPATDRLSV